jgi:hypothetical protein
LVLLMSLLGSLVYDPDVGLMAKNRIKSKKSCSKFIVWFLMSTASGAHTMNPWSKRYSALDSNKYNSVEVLPDASLVHKKQSEFEVDMCLQHHHMPGGPTMNTCQDPGQAWAKAKPNYSSGKPG